MAFDSELTSVRFELWRGTTRRILESLDNENHQFRMVAGLAEVAERNGRRHNSSSRRGCLLTHDHGLVSAAKTRDLRSALPRVNYLLVDIGRHGWPRSGAMLTERLRKLSSNLIDAHALDV